ncbi:MAG TPA: Gfo/Idh/MocA family oxidoreductase [Thermomicrobiales bacterium]|nr:Gfo/Idh/MocA family oxidoreductase [Thermomicrobiales bacterium]
MQQSSPRPVRVGLVGLGEVAQVTHIPVLAHLEDRFTITAIADVSPGLVAAIGDRLHLPTDARHTDAGELVGRDDVDLVFVLTSDEYHADQAVAALEAGKHVLIEKPVALTIPDVERIIAARDASGRHAIVGYMRRFADAFTLMKDRLPELGPIRYARVRDIIGQNRQFIEQVEQVLRFDDLTDDQKRDRGERARTQVATALGETPTDLVRAYRLLCGLGSHDLSAMRELIGVPNHVVGADAWLNGEYVAAIFAVDDYRVTFEMGGDRQVRFDAHIAVYGETGTMTVEYDTPYIRHLPTTLTVERTEGTAYHREQILPGYTDPYTRELVHVHDVLHGSAVPKTTLEDSLHDLRLFRQIIDRIRANG